MLDAERCILCTRCNPFQPKTSRATTRWASSIAAASIRLRLFQECVRQQLHAQHGGHLPRRRAHVEGFRFKMRVWFLKETKAFATSCGTGCNVLIGSREDVIQPLHAARQRRRQRPVDV